MIIGISIYSLKKTRILLVICNLLNSIDIFSIYQSIDFTNRMNETARTSNNSLSNAVLADSFNIDVNSKLYMMEVDKNKLQSIKNAMKAIMDGK